MANDVTIVVEASLGDTLLKLELAKAAVGDLEDAGYSAGVTLGDDTNRNSFSSRIRNLRNELSNMGDRGPLGTIVRGFGNLAAAMLSPIQFGADMAKNFEEVGTVSQVLVGILSSLGVALVTLAAVAAAATFAAVGLADILGTLVAIAADFVAPLTIVTGLLGGLAAGFVIGGKRAAEGGGKLNAFSKIVDTLGSMFQKTSSILAHVFLPYFVELGHAAEQALTFLDKIIKLPLGQAFHELDTQGTKMLGQFVDRVAEVLGKPIRLAFKVAFTDTAFSNMVADWWHRFTGFLFGYVDRHPMTRLDILKGSKPTTHQVDGIFQPLIDWFNRHHFTQQGIQIGRQILRGVLNSGMRDRLSTFLVDVLKDAGKKSAIAYLQAVRWMTIQFARLFTVVPRTIYRLLGPAWDWMKRKAGEAWGWIKDKAGGILSTVAGWVRGKLGDAWDAVKTAVGNVWDWIVQKIETPFHISIDWPSPPGWFMSLIGGAGGIISGIGSGGSTDVRGSGTGGPHPGVRPSVAMAAPNVFVTIHQADLSDAPTRRRIAQQVGKEIASDWRRRAGGH